MLQWQDVDNCRFELVPQHNLAGTYAQNTPGITPSTITAAANGSINGAALASFPVAWMERLIHCASVISFCCLIRRIRKRMASIRFSASGINRLHGSCAGMGWPRQRASCPSAHVSTSQMVMYEVTRTGSMSMPMFINSTPLRVTPGTARYGE